MLLLNPPSVDRVHRDHYCAASSKTGHYWPQIDLLLNSGFLTREHEVLVLDAVVESLNPSQALSRVQAFDPEAIVALGSILTLKEDLEFLAACKRATGCQTVVMGDVFYFQPDLLIQHEAVDAIARQYPASGIVSFLRGEPEAPDLIVKRNGVIKTGPYSKGTALYPTPRHELFPLKSYRFPLTVREPFSMVLTSLSCPMGCSYCPVATVPPRQRPLADVMTELDELKRLGVRELVVADLMLNASPVRLKELCRQMIAQGHEFTWSCLLRPDLVDEETATLLSQAGCHTVLFGVDTSSEALLRSNNRRMDLKKARRGFTLTRNAGVRAFAFLILGLPGETWNTARESIDYVCRLDADYLSVNLFVPRPGSRYMPRYKTLEEMLGEAHRMDSSRTPSSHCGLSNRQLTWLKRYALARFYFRPSLIVRHLMNWKSIPHLQQLVVRGARLLWSAARPLSRERS